MNQISCNIFGEELIKEALLRLNSTDNHNNKYQKLLEENDLIIRPIPPGHKSLLRTVSDCLFFTTKYHEQIQNLCVSHFQRLYKNKNLPTKLSNFKGNHNLISDYCLNPNQDRFEKVNLELISIIFKVKIIIYQVNEDNYLSATIYNNQNENQIQVFKDEQSYQPLYSKEFMLNAQMMQDIIYDIINQTLKQDRKPSLIFRNLEQEIWEEEQEFSNIARLPSLKEQGKKISFSENTTPQKHMAPPQSNYFNFYPDNNKYQINMIPPVEEDFQPYINLKTAQDKTQQFKFFENSPFQVNQTNSTSKQLFFAEDYIIKELPNRLNVKQIEEPQYGPISPLSFDNYNINSGNYQSMLQQQKRMGGFSGNTNLTTAVNNFSMFPSNDFQHDPLMKAFSQPPTAIQIQKPNSTNGVGVGTTMSSGSNMSNNNSNEKQHAKQDSDDDDILEEVNRQTQQQMHVQRKPIILNEPTKKYTGKLKFFDENKNYGFFILDEDNSDIFVHFDDLSKAGVTKAMLQQYKSSENPLRFQFSCMNYIGKYNKSRKAIDIQQMVATAESVRKTVPAEQSKSLKN